MRKKTFWIAYVLLLLIQLSISNYFRLTPYIMLSILPVMVLCISTRLDTLWTMLIAFATGMTVDLLSEGVLGLNALALVPVAFFRNPIIQLIFGKELFARKEDFSVKSSGLAQIGLALLLAQALFLVLYIWADGAGMRPFSFNFHRFLASLGAGFLLSLLTLNVLATDYRE